MALCAEKVCPASALTGVQTVVSSEPLPTLAGVILASASVEAEVVTTLCPRQHLTIHCMGIFITGYFAIKCINKANSEDPSPHLQYSCLQCSLGNTDMSHCSSRHSLGIQEYLERKEKGRRGEVEGERGEEGKSREGEEGSGKWWITHSVMWLVRHMLRT